MDKALWIARKNYLHSLIVEISRRNGGDTTDEIQQHYLQLIAEHPDEAIEDAIMLYETLKIHL